MKFRVNPKTADFIVKICGGFGSWMKGTRTLAGRPA
jgi:hypothetical protein